MDLLAKILSKDLRAGDYAPDHDFWFNPVGMISEAGLRVDENSAQKLSAWYRGRDILATSLAMLPLHLYERLPNDEGKVKARTHPLYSTLHHQISGWLNSFNWRRLMMRNLIDHGNGYNYIMPGENYRVGQLWPIVPPTLVTPKLEDNGRKIFFVRRKNGMEERRTQEEIFHVMGASEDGVVGKGILEWAKDSIGLSQATESYASRIYSQGALHGGILKVPGKLNRLASERMAESFDARVRGQNRWHRPVVLEQGADWVPNTMTAQQAQMISSRQYSVKDLARWLGLPPHMLGDLEGAIKSNIEQQGEEFIAYNLGPWLSLFEFSFREQLIDDPDTFFVEFRRDALVRGSIAVRWAAHVSGVNAGIVAPNEVRELENMNKLPGLDEPRTPANIVGNRTPGSSDEKEEIEAEQSERDANARQIGSIVRVSAQRLLTKEINAVRRAAVKNASDSVAFGKWVRAFYARHVAFVMEALALSRTEAEEYCRGQVKQLLGQPGLSALETWRLSDYAAGLASLAVGYTGATKKEVDT